MDDGSAKVGLVPFLSAFAKSDHILGKQNPNCDKKKGVKGYSFTRLTNAHLGILTIFVFCCLCVCFISFGAMTILIIFNLYLEDNRKMDLQNDNLSFQYHPTQKSLMGWFLCFWLDTDTSCFFFLSIPIN